VVVDRNLRLSRGAALVKPPKGESVLIVGAGGIGSNAVHVLASMGLTDFTVVDFDYVGEENIFPGFFVMGDVGEAKVTALANYADNMGDIIFTAYNCRFVEFKKKNRRHFTFAIISTDSTESRREIWHSVKDMAEVVIDGRMGGVLCSVFTITDEVSASVYEDALEGGNAELPCGQKATAPLTKGMIPFMIGNAIGRYLNGLPPIFLQRYDMGLGMLLKIPAKDEQR